MAEGFDRIIKKIRMYLLIIKKYIIKLPCPMSKYKSVIARFILIFRQLNTNDLTVILFPIYHPPNQRLFAVIFNDADFSSLYKYECATLTPLFS